MTDLERLSFMPRASWPPRGPPPTPAAAPGEAGFEAVVRTVDSPVLIDRGIRRGTDVLTSLGLGARAVPVGRPPMWGLAVGGCTSPRCSGGVR